MFGQTIYRHTAITTKSAVLVRKHRNVGFVAVSPALSTEGSKHCSRLVTKKKKMFATMRRAADNETLKVEKKRLA